MVGSAAAAAAADHEAVVAAADAALLGDDAVAAVLDAAHRIGAAAVGVGAVAGGGAADRVTISLRQPDARPEGGASPHVIDRAGHARRRPRRVPDPAGG